MKTPASRDTGDYHFLHTKRLSLKHARRLLCTLRRRVLDLDELASGDFLRQRGQTAARNKLSREDSPAAVGPNADRAERRASGGAKKCHAGGSDVADIDPRCVEPVVHHQLDTPVILFVLPGGLKTLHLCHSKNVKTKRTAGIKTGMATNVAAKKDCGMPELPHQVEYRTVNANSAGRHGDFDEIFASRRRFPPLRA
jgi:hypothetical protein